MTVTKKNKKGDMSIQMIVGIVIALVIIMIAIYMVSGKAKIANKAGGCSADMCKEKASDCPAGTQYSYTPCTKDDKHKTKGKCCFSI